MPNRLLNFAPLDRRRFLALSAGGAAAAAAVHFSGLEAAEPRVAEQLPSPEERRKLPVTSWRTFESGYHNGPTVHFDQLDPEDYMARVREARTEVVIIETKSHWGYAYYNTKVGRRHPNLNYDLIARWVEAGHKNGLSVVAYYSGQVDMQSALRYPHWVGRNADGSLSRVGRHWFWCCHHSPYRPYALGMYREIFSQYEFDGLFIDGAPAPRWLPEPVCHCQWCLEQYERDHGESLLDGIETPQGYRKRLQWFQGTSEKYLDEVYELVHLLRPGVPIWLNQGSPVDMSTKILHKTACLYTEPITSPTGLSVGSIVTRAWKMPGPQVGIFWRGYARAPIETDQFRTAAILMQATRPRYITDEQNMPDGRQRVQFFEWAGQLQQEVEKVEGFLADLEPVTSIGVLFSEATRDHLAAEKKFGGSISGGQFVDSIVGSLEVLTKTHYPVEVIPDWHLEPDHLAQFDMVVLPEVESLAKEYAQALREYVAKKGTLLATWKPGMVDERGGARSNFALADVLGVDFVEEVTKYAGKDGPGIYLLPTNHALASFLGAGEIAILRKSGGAGGSYCPFVQVKGDAESILDYRLPYLVPDLDKHVFQTWNPAPPGNEIIPQAATLHRYGQGQAVYVGLPLFARYHPELSWVEEWVAGIVQRLVPRPAIRVESGGPLHVAFFRQGPRRLLIQMVNYSVWTGNGRTAPVRDAEIVGLRAKFAAQSARLLWPRQEPLKVVAGEPWRVRVPEVSLYNVIAVELK